MNCFLGNGHFFSGTLVKMDVAGEGIGNRLGSMTKVPAGRKLNSRKIP